MVVARFVGLLTGVGRSVEMTIRGTPSQEHVDYVSLGIDCERAFGLGRHRILSGLIGPFAWAMLKSLTLADENQVLGFYDQKFSEYSLKTGHNYAGGFLSGGEWTENGSAGFNAPATTLADQVARDHDWLIYNTSGNRRSQSRNSRLSPRANGTRCRSRRR